MHEISFIAVIAKYIHTLKYFIYMVIMYTVNDRENSFTVNWVHL